MPDLARLCTTFSGTKVKKDGNLLKINTSEEGNRHALRLPRTAGLKKYLIHSLKLNGDTSDWTPHPQSKNGGAEKQRLSVSPQ